MIQRNSNFVSAPVKKSCQTPTGQKRNLTYVRKSNSSAYGMEKNVAQKIYAAQSIDHAKFFGMLLFILGASEKRHGNPQPELLKCLRALWRKQKFDRRTSTLTKKQNNCETSLDDPSVVDENFSFKYLNGHIILLQLRVGYFQKDSVECERTNISLCTSVLSSKHGKISRLHRKTTFFNFPPFCFLL